ncbi:MAG TPA: primosomal protein [Candidatus Thioglobus sp.]|jgi:hypothetical protein|nr:primosomal protein [Candidatus Thioglobus sp.]
MRLISEINESVNYITEGKGKDLYIEGVFLQADLKNRNGRMYPGAIMENEVKRYTETYIDKKRAFGELGHPDGPTINLDRVSHMITSLVKEGSNYIGKAKVLDTPQGNIVKNLINEGAQLGVSSRGMGTLKANKQGIQEVQSDFYLATAADIVADPSAPDAFVNGIMEGKEWVWDNGIIKEHDIAEMKKEIESTSKNKLTGLEARIFEKFMSGL